MSRAIPLYIIIFAIRRLRFFSAAVFLFGYCGEAALTGVAAGFGLNVSSSSSSGIILSSVLLSNSAFISSILLVSYFFSGSIFLYPFK